jgi:hypothetical protein
MLKKYKNGFIGIIKKQRLDAADFSILENKSGQDPSGRFIVPGTASIYLVNRGQHRMAVR